MKKLIISMLLPLLCFMLPATAGEGMWIPSLLEQMNEKEMRQMGFRLTAEDIYSINRSSLKDAVVLFGSGCTAGIISEEGLILTNHHCGYGQIQAHSSLEKDYLTNGFWAMRREEELPCKGLTVELLIRMEDVTGEVLAGITDKMTEAVRDSIVAVNQKKIIDRETKDSHYTGKITAFYYGNVYYLFITEVFKDVRLVGAPPGGIGKFGGDTDNWMWPRHTGDFSMFRIYAGKDNLPAEWSEENVPYKPKKSLTISMKGYEKEDFTFVFGYPGRTQQFIPSWAVSLVSEVENPVRIRLRGRRLDAINQFMAQDPLTRIQYAAKAAGIANGWKKWTGENNGLKRLGTVQNKREAEREFSTWVMGERNRKTTYQGLLGAFEAVYKKMTPVSLAYVYYTEAGLGIELVRLAGRFNKLIMLSEQGKAVDEELSRLISSIPDFYKNYNPSVDRAVMPYLLSEYATHTDQAYLPGVFAEIRKKYGTDYQRFTNDAFQESMLVSKEKLLDFLEHYKPSRHKKLLKDPFVRLAVSFSDTYREKIADELSGYRDITDSLQRVYVKALMEMSPGKRFYPDANLTLRVAYGQVMDYTPRDAVHYDYYTTLAGILEKEDPAVEDYAVDPRLKALYQARDFGKYADQRGMLRTCFIATNHTSGGNSGSPVFNADGQLIGINFDRNWEGTMSDINYDIRQCRNITLDVRYCLFVVDKVCGAGHLLNEMKLVY
ncbi:MAG TPA: S46 family peptidase [Bacteroidales bacterium]|nr:S46 family peptidase [Bacteroidales bacterium]HSA43687.1 S46 family peptidase [Bacteroidales bacterium]